MNIELVRNDNELIIKLDGELNSDTASSFEHIISTSLKDVKILKLDFEKLSYLSSAGLRIILVAQKIMNEQGEMIIQNVNKKIMDIFEMTGFINILHFEN